MGNDTVHFSDQIEKKKLLTRSFFQQQGSANSDMTSRAQGYVLQQCFLPARLSKLGRDLLQGYTLQKCFLLARLSKLGRDLPQGYVLMEHQHVDDNRFEPENKKAHINQNVQVQDLNTTRIVEFYLH